MKLLYKEDKHFIMELNGKKYEFFIGNLGRWIKIYNEDGESENVNL